MIITLDTLTTAIQPLVTWETAKGRNVYVATTTWIDANYTGYDLAEKMRNFLRDKYPTSEWGIEDVCLIGHYDDVPMRRTAQDLGYGQPETDFYYAELSKPDNQSWDADGDHKYGENSDPIDFTAEVNVGRIPWSAVNTVTSICQKSVDFENDNDPGFKRNILLLGGFFWADTDNAVLMEYKTNPANHPWMADWTATRMYEKNKDYSSNYPCDYELLRNNVLAHWPNEKYAFVNWGGHGSPTSCHIAGLGAPAFITGSDSAQLDDTHPAIIFAAACSNSDTDNLNIGQSMLKQGGVGFLGATKVALGCPGWSNPNNGSCQSYDYYFTTAVTSGDYTQGEAHQYALYQMYSKGLWAYQKYEGFEWGALWGSPTLRLDMDPILAMNVGTLPEGLNPPGPAHTLTIEIGDALENYVAGTGKLHYRFDPADPFTDVAVTPLGNDLYEAVLPNTKPGDQPEFYFSAQGDQGTTVYMPYDAPAKCYSFEVGFVTELFFDDFEADLGWTVDNTSVSTGAFERGDPQGTSAQPEDDHSPNGTKCYVTGRLSGSGVGSYDLDGGPTRLISPNLDMASGDGVIEFYMYFHHTDYGTQQPLQIHFSNNGGTSWQLVTMQGHSPGWNLYTFKVGDYITPTSQVKIRFTATDNPNDDLVECLVDDFAVKSYNFTPSLWADGYAMSVTQPTRIELSLDASAAQAGRKYLLLGTISGTSPGFMLPGGQVMPINWDAFTNLMLSLLGTSVLQNGMGTLDAMGCATAIFDSPGGLDPTLIGYVADFAFLLAPPPGWDYASNSVGITFEP